MRTRRSFIRLLKTTKTRSYYLSFLCFLSLIFLFKSYYYTTTVNFNIKRHNVVIYDSSSKYPDEYNISFYDPENAAMDNDDMFFQWCPFQEKSDEDYVDDGLDCQELFTTKNRSVWEDAKDWTSPCPYNDSDIMNMTADCTDLKKAFPFRWPTTESREFPLAFVLLVAEHSEQVLRLLQSIYRPWNLYCIAYDNDTSYEFKRSIHNLNLCFENVILPEEFVDVNWGGFSILNSVMNCMKVLNRHVNKWRYVQILSWNDFPLKTNAEMVQIMQIFNGSQDAELAQGQTSRFLHYHKESTLDESKKSMKKPLPPGNMVIYKGSMSATLSREFINFTMNNPVAKRFYKWSKTNWAPEESYFVSLIHNLHTGVPNGFPGTCLAYYEFQNKPKPFVSRYQIWYNNCEGLLTSGSCAFGVGDLHKLYKRHELVAHKFYLDFEPATYYCMAKLHFLRTFNRTKYRKLNRNYYRRLPAVRYQNMKNKKNFQC